jgi:glucose 1-dehydrogenase
MRLLGKRALVTGGARGIGRGCAMELARAGADVALNDLDRTDEALAVAAEVEALGRRAAVVEGNAFDHDACGDVLRRAIEALGGVDILVSNPAYSRRGDFLDYPIETFEKVLRGTLTGGFSMSQHVARHLVERGAGGKIVFISSVHARRPYPRSVAYNAAKAGLNHMAGTIAAELLRYRINVNVIEPGWIETPGEQETFGVDYIRQVAPTLPWGRLGTPEDIGKAAVFLASDDADYITGASIVVDGGFLLREGHS